MAQRIRIKDIAKLAGVSAGTVDRVLHNRARVSPDALAKVQRALQNANYQPNAYASALAYNRSYLFAVVIPAHEQVAYWEEIEEGVRMAQQARSDFSVRTQMLYYERFDEASFTHTTEECLALQPDGVVIVPTDKEITRRFTEQLHERNIPFVMLDSYMPDLKPLSFFGQDSLSSGYFAARMLMLLAAQEKAILLVKMTLHGRVVSQQQDNREVGFRRYMAKHFPQVQIQELDLPLTATREECHAQINRYLDAHPELHHCITLGSKAHLVGELLIQTGRKGVQIMGYDMLDKNAECLRKGSISLLIAQHAYQQGYCSVDTLFRAVVLRMQVQPVNYMPIELLTKENVDFYRRTQL